MRKRRPGNFDIDEWWLIGGFTVDGGPRSYRRTLVLAGARATGACDVGCGGTGTVEEFAYTLEHLALMVGGDSPAHLRGIARALHNVSWGLPPPEPVTPERNVFGFHTCLCETACDFLAADDNAAPLNAEVLLDPLPRKPAVRKMCFVHHKAKLTPGFRFVAARGDNGTAAYVANAVVSEETAYRLLKKGWRCLFVKDPRGPSPMSARTAKPAQAKRNPPASGGG